MAAEQPLMASLPSSGQRDAAQPAHSLPEQAFCLAPLMHLPVAAGALADHASSPHLGGFLDQSATLHAQPAAPAEDAQDAELQAPAVRRRLAQEILNAAAQPAADARSAAAAIATAGVSSARAAADISALIAG